MFFILKKLGLKYRDRSIIHNPYENQEAIERREHKEKEANITNGVK